MNLKQGVINYRTAIILGVLTVVCADSGFAQGYGGPSMLSRGGNRPGQRGRAPVDIEVYGALRGVMETGLTPVRVEDDGTFSSDTLYSAQVEIGAYGTHSWKKAIVGLDYRGDYRKSTRSLFKNYDGTNQALALDIEYRATRRTQLMFRETAGTSNRAFGGFAAPATSDLNSLGLANNEVFDTRVYFTQTSLTVAHQTSARTTWVGSGDTFTVKRPDNALVSLTGYRATGSWNYRINRRDSLGVLYTYMRFDFRRVFGGSDMHGVALQAQRRLTRNIQLDLTAGGFLVDTFGTQRVQLSPEVAAILGRSSGVEAFNRRLYIPQIQASARYTLERSTFSLGYMAGANPGNGVYLTSRQDAISAGYSFTGIKKLSLGLSTNYSRLKSVGVDIGNLTSYRGGGGVNYSLSRLLNLSSQFDWRTYSSPGLRGREGYSVTLGITVSPAPLPLSIW